MLRLFPQGHQVTVLTLLSRSFNCNLPVYSCGQFAPCSEYSGKCNCPAGFGGDNCLEPRMHIPFIPAIGISKLHTHNMLQNADL
jgi:hypothetical protein